MNETITRARFVDIVPSWPQGTDVTVVPGVPGRGWTQDEEVVYPIDTVDFVKLGRESGVRIGYARDDPPAYVDLRAAEHWLPVFVVAEEAISAGIGTLLADVIKQLIHWPTERRTLLHLRVGRARHDDIEVTFLEATGDVEDVLAALDRFLANDE